MTSKTNPANKKKPSTRGELNLRKQTSANEARLVALGFQGKICLSA